MEAQAPLHWPGSMRFGGDRTRLQRFWNPALIQYAIGGSGRLGGWAPLEPLPFGSFDHHFLRDLGERACQPRPCRSGQALDDACEVILSLAPDLGEEFASARSGSDEASLAIAWFELSRAEALFDEALHRPTDLGRIDFGRFPDQARRRLPGHADERQNTPLGHRNAKTVVQLP